jgi:hypothetical protein
MIVLQNRFKTQGIIVIGSEAFSCTTLIIMNEIVKNHFFKKQKAMQVTGRKAY